MVRLQNVVTLLETWTVLVYGVISQVHEILLKVLFRGLLIFFLKWRSNKFYRLTVQNLASPSSHTYVLSGRVPTMTT